MERNPIFQIRLKEESVIHVFKVSEKDAWSICDFVTANEDRLLDFFPSTRAQNLTPDLSKRFVAQKEKQFQSNEEYLYVLKPVDSRKVIGLVYLKELDWENKQGEFAYAIDYNYEGKGITSQIVKKISNHAFQELELKTLQIFVHKTNIPSVRVAEKSNFVWIRTEKNKFQPKGKEPMDMELYERYKS